MSLKIAITGPESSAKSSLAVQLSMHYKGTLITEYSRDYLHHTKGKYQQHDLLIMAEEHNKLLKQNELNSRIQIWDTDLLTYNIWYEEKYKSKNQELAALWQENVADYYIICYPDTPWIWDPLRESRDDRFHLFYKYLEAIRHLKVRFNILSGNGFYRFIHARWYIDNLLQKIN